MCDKSKINNLIKEETSDNELKIDVEELLEKLKKELLDKEKDSNKK